MIIVMVGYSLFDDIYFRSNLHRIEMVSRKKKMVLVWTVSTILLLWAVLTVLAQLKGSENMTEIGNPTNIKKALIVYSPDLFYNLDEQICIAFAEGLSENQWYSKVATVSTAEKLNEEPFDLYVFCANTYNWAPDRPTKKYIENHPDLKGKNVVAITLGSGSTERAKRILERTVKDKGSKLIGSKEFWLLKPNDESRSNESNTLVATDRANGFGRQITDHIENEKGKKPLN